MLCDKVSGVLRKEPSAGYPAVLITQFLWSWISLHQNVNWLMWHNYPCYKLMVPVGRLSNSLQLPLTLPSSLTSSILEGKVGKPPHVSQAHCISNHRQDEIQFTRPVSPGLVLISIIVILHSILRETVHWYWHESSYSLRVHSNTHSIKQACSMQHGIHHCRYEYDMFCIQRREIHFTQRFRWCVKNNCIYAHCYIWPGMAESIVVNVALRAYVMHYLSSSTSGQQKLIPGEKTLALGKPSPAREHCNNIGIYPCVIFKKAWNQSNETMQIQRSIGQHKM